MGESITNYLLLDPTQREGDSIENGDNNKNERRDSTCQTSTEGEYGGEGGSEAVGIGYMDSGGACDDGNNVYTVAKSSTIGATIRGERHLNR